MQIKDIVAGKKFITKSGEEKTNWTTVGHIFIKDDGAMSVKFNGYINPLAFANEKGEVWFNVFEQKKDKHSTLSVPSNEEVSRKVIAEGKDYAAKFKAQAVQAVREAISDEPQISAADEQWFKENAEALPF